MNILLHTNTEFSFLNSTIKIKNLIETAKKNDVKALAITDINNMFGIGSFIDLCQKNDIKPLIGLEIDLEEATVFLIAKNYDGYVFLNNLSFRKSKSEQILISQLENNNVFVIDHELKGYQNRELEFPNISNFWANNKTHLKIQTVYAPVKKVLFSEDIETLNILQKIGNLPVDNLEFHDYFSPNDFENVENKVLENIEEIVQSVDIKFPNAEIKLAHFKNDQNVSNEDFLKLKCINFLKKNLKLFVNFDPNVIQKRFEYEFEVIKNLGFIDYFLIIVDVLEWAREQKIYVGPGRGSVAGSLIAFLLEITKINPLQYNLIFERFLNTDRVTMPDIDIDIQDDRREEIAKYIVEKYGYEYTSLITTFQRIGAKMAIRDVARILKIPLFEVEKITKTIDATETLSDTNRKNEKFKSLIAKFPLLNKFAQEIEGFTRQYGIHPAGIIISNQKITNIAPTYWNTTNLQQVQLSLKYLEKFGLLKIDFLGLKTLNIIHDIEKVIDETYIFENVQNRTSNIFSDKQTLKLINQGHTEGIFQLESAGMKNAIWQVKADTFDDLVAIISLFRPGPMQYIEQYARNKVNRKLIDKIHPIYDKIVEPTFGIIVYQEQIMEIAQKVANMTFSQADLLRRAISKKDEEELKTYKSSFFEGGKKNNIDMQILNNIFLNIEKFADYGFNKSHAVSYAYITFKMAYYKAHFPYIFYRSLLTSAQGAHATINKYIEEIKKIGIKVTSPNINKSKNHVVLIDGELILPFNMIKGLGVISVEKILTERKNKSQYKNFFECYLRLRFFGITDGVIELLIKSNSMRDFGNQQTLFADLFQAKSAYLMLENSIKFTTKNQKLKEGLSQEQKQEVFDNFLNNLNIKELSIEPNEIDIEKEAENENELLGNIYNAFVTKPYETDIKIENTPIQREVWMAVCVEKIKISKMFDYNTIVIYDSSQKITLYIDQRDFLRFKLMPKHRPIYAKLYRSLRNKYYLKDWRELNNEK